MDAVNQLATQTSTSAACDALGVSRASLYRARRRAESPPAPSAPRLTPARALSADEHRAVLDTLNSERFVDLAPAQVYAALLDEGLYLCSIRTMYRILEQAAQVRERRNQAKHPQYAKPELLATGPNQLWSWDITKLRGPVKWTYFYLYVILDVYSRYVVGWLLAHHETSALAEKLIQTSCDKQGIGRQQLTLHADRGSAMKSKAVALLLSDLGVTKSHSRPYTSDDNPYSESQFKTLKYRPDFPDRFGSLQDARVFCRDFFNWYNNEHHHSGIALMTPAMVHYGRADDVHQQRQLVLNDAYESHPERFVRKPPQPPTLPEAVWINPPKGDNTTQPMLTNIPLEVSQSR